MLWIRNCIISIPQSCCPAVHLIDIHLSHMTLFSILGYWSFQHCKRLLYILTFLSCLIFAFDLLGPMSEEWHLVFLSTLFLTPSSS